MSATPKMAPLMTGSDRTRDIVHVDFTISGTEIITCFCEYNYCQQALSLQPTTISPASLFLRRSIRDVIHWSAHLDIMLTSASTVSLFRKHPYFLDEMLKSAIGLPV